MRASEQRASNVEDKEQQDEQREGEDEEEDERVDEAVEALEEDDDEREMEDVLTGKERRQQDDQGSVRKRSLICELRMLPLWMTRTTEPIWNVKRRRNSRNLRNFQDSLMRKTSLQRERSSSLQHQSRYVSPKITLYLEETLYLFLYLSVFFIQL